MIQFCVLLVAMVWVVKILCSVSANLTITKVMIVQTLQFVLLFVSIRKYHVRHLRKMRMDANSQIPVLHNKGILTVSYALFTVHSIAVGVKCYGMVLWIRWVALQIFCV